MERDSRLDILRGIGLLCIILAHVSPPALVLQLRTFDVPLMVLVSGAAFAKTGFHYRSYLAYFFNRLLRLAGSTWIFLISFFLLTFLILMALHKPYPFSTTQIISSFLFLEGIGYVWIVRVFLLTAATAPLVMRLNGLIRSRLVYFSLLFLIYCAYEAAFHLYPASAGSLFDTLCNELLYYVIPYGCLFALGTRISFQNRKEALFLALVMFLLFIASGSVLYSLSGHIEVSQTFKYPPRIYYIAYGGFVALALHAAVATPSLCRYLPQRFLAFVGQSTMWCYLWHIWFIFLTGWISKALNIPLPWHIRYLIVLFCTLVCVSVQKRLLAFAFQFKMSKPTARILSTLFSG